MAQGVSFHYVLLALAFFAVALFMAAIATVTTYSSRYDQAPVLSGVCNPTPDPVLCNQYEGGLYFMCLDGRMFTCGLTGWVFFNWNQGATGGGGTSGTTGTTGTSGSMGNSGGSGALGQTGKTGGTGTTGTTGSLGRYGSTGEQGATGASGRTGRTGTTGGTGQHGRIGSSGGVGSSGSSGATGTAGNTGTTGGTGATGNTGALGTTGGLGATGFTGSSGANGQNFLSITCPADFVGFVTDIPTISLTGNASTVVASPCANLTLSYSDSAPPVAQFKRKAKFEPTFLPNTNNGTIQTSIPMNGHLDGFFLPNFTDTGPVPGFDPATMGGGGRKRSVTFPTDWTQQVGNYTAAFMMNTTGTTVLPNRMGFPSLEIDEAGEYRYFTHIGLPMSQVVQHDYYSMFSNLHVFNPGQVFLPNSSCYIGNNWGSNTSHYPRKMRYDVLSNRFFIVYIPLNYTIDVASNLCVVVSNNTNFFYGGAYGYNIPLPFNASGPNRMDVGILNNSVQVCFDAVNEPFAPSFFSNAPYPGAARFGNCVIIQKSNLLLANITAPICSVGLPGVRGNYDAYQNATAAPMHLTSASSVYNNDMFYNNLAWQLGLYYQAFVNNFGRQRIDMNSCTSAGLLFGNLLLAPNEFSFWNNWNISSSVPFLQNGVEIDIGHLAIQVYLNGDDAVGTAVVNTDGIKKPSIMVFTIFDEASRGLIELPNTVLYGGSPTFVYEVGTVVVAYNQFSTNTSNQIPSTYFSYRLSTDPSGQYRSPKYNVQMNGLTNPQQISLVNNTNLISTGIAPKPGKMEFTMMGMGNSPTINLYDMIHDDFRIQGETFIRTFTLSDACNSTSCTQTIYLNSTQSLIIQCPATYYGTILDGNGTYVPLNVSGNASWSYLGYTCGSVSMTHTDATPTVPLNLKRKRDEPEFEMTVTTIDPPVATPVGEGHLMGSDENYVDLPIPDELMMTGKKRSVTWNSDWTQKVGNFPSPTTLTGSFASDSPWLSSLETDGTLRYAVFSGNNTLAILQTDYYNIQGNVHFFNPASASIFPPGTNCYINGTGWPNSLKRDIALNRYVFSYMNPANASKLCLVMSNTNDFFNGGGYGYEFSLPYVFGSVSRFDFGILGNTYSFCFDDYTRPVVIPGDTAEKALQYGNCFTLNRNAITSGLASTNMCSIGVNVIFNTDYTNSSVTPLSPSTEITSSVFFSLPFVSPRYTCFTYIAPNMCFSNQQNLVARNFSNFASCIVGNTVEFPYSGVFSNTSSIAFGTRVPTNPFLPSTNGITNVNPGLEKISLDMRISGSSALFTYAFTAYNGTQNSVIIYGYPTGNQATAFAVYDPNPGTYLTGLNVFAPNIKFLFDGSIVMSYQQTSHLGAYPVPSTAYAYALVTDPSFQMRQPVSSLTLNGLTNPQQLTLVNMTNPIVAGLAVVPNRYEFSIFGPGNANNVSFWDFVNQDFRIQSESVQRTFTVTDGCGSTSCTQQIFLNSTRSLILTCPATYVGYITDGNGTYVSPSVSGNATIYSGNPCGTPVLTWTTENPPSFIQATKRDEEEENMILYFNLSDQGQVPPPTTGEMQGHVDHYNDLSMLETILNTKRSVTSPNDWSQMVGNFATTFVINSNQTPGFTWLGAIETDGVLRYAIYNTNQSFAILQHDYYNINGNVHFFNPGEVFPSNSFCNPVDNQTGWIHDIKRDFYTGRYVFVYFNPANYSKLCVVLSNTGDFFNGGGYGYEMNLPYLFNSAQNLQIASYNGYFTFCFDDRTQNVSKNNVTSYVGPLYWGNCFIMEYSVMMSAQSDPRICALQFNSRASSSFTTMTWTPYPYHQRYTILTGAVNQNASHLITIFNRNSPASVSMWANTCIDCFPYNFTGCYSTNNANIAAGVNIASAELIPPTPTITPVLLNNFISPGDERYSTDFVQFPVIGRVGAFAYVDTANSTTASIVWGASGLSFSSFNARFSPRVGLHVFAPSIRIIATGDNFIGIVLAYQQANSNTSYAVPSTSYAYWLSTDPQGVLRVPSDPLVFNGLSNPQTITNINGSNPISTGLAVVPNLNEFSIFGAGNLGSYIHQDFRIQGERFTRTFTLTDGCGNVSCVQEIYLNSTRSLILTCPATYYGNIYEGNGTYLAPSVTGNATTYIGSPCGTPTLTFTTENPPTNNVQEFRKRQTSIEDMFTVNVNENPVSVNLGNPVEGHLMGSIGQFTDLPLPPMTENQTADPGTGRRRSVTWARDWTQQVGYFGSTYNVSYSKAALPWISVLETNGVLRYAVYKSLNVSFAVLQHEYNNISGSVHFFNPGEVFSGGPCFVGNNTSIGDDAFDLKWDLTINRFVFVYKLGSANNKFCLVMSNTSDFFNGGGVGYEIDLPYSFGADTQRLQFSVNGDVYSFCFDDYSQNVTKNADVNYTGPLYWGNCFALERARIITGAASPRICPLQVNLFIPPVNPGIPVLSYTIRTITQTTTVVLPGTGLATGRGYVGMFFYTFPGYKTVYMAKNLNTTNWDFSLPCDISVGSTVTNPFTPNVTSINYSTVPVPVVSNGLSAAAFGSIYSSDVQDAALFATAWTIVDPTLTQNTKIGLSALGFFSNLAPFPSVTMNTVFDPYPGNYTHGVHVFNPTIRILNNKSGFVLAYQQTTLNPNLAFPSTSYAYWLNSDPTTAFRPAEYPLYMNNLANPQRLTATNMTNPINTGLAIPPFPVLGFSIFGPGDAVSDDADSWSFINQNFQIAGERWTRTFTLSDACGNTSCVQEIYLNASTFNSSNT